MNTSTLLGGEKLFNEVSLSKYLNIKDVLKQKVVVKEGTQRNTILTEIGKAKFNIKDKKKLELASLLLDRWMLYNIYGDKHVYVKHVASERFNTLYQIILGGDKEWNGIYEFPLKGKEVKISGEEINDRKTLVIESDGNYDIALFKKKGTAEPYAVTRLDYDTDEEFKEALLETNLIDEEDLEIYYDPDKIIKPYLNRILPRIILK